MKTPILILALIIYHCALSQEKIPHLQKKGTSTQLIVDGKPFIILGGELGNSTATTMKNMQPVWSKLTEMNLNTVLVPVYWELIEPQEGKFDFSLYDDLITEARRNDLKIVFLWFGTWKNSMSSHVPAWVKFDQDKYPRAKDQSGKSQEILSSFSDKVLKADIRAFENLMRFIKEFDYKEHTVIMVQVENEIGMLPSARDHQSLAEEAFRKNVPSDLMKYLEKNKTRLVPEFDAVWKANGYKSSGNWEQVFGKGLHTDETFMAWYYSVFANKVAEAGKKIYPIPMFVNAALNRPNWEPGRYPSAGPLPHLMDVWKAAGTDIDFLSPDFYNPEFKHWCDLYMRQGDPLFVPEHVFDQTAAIKALFAIGQYEALGFSPFSIESKEHPEDEPLGKVYGLLGNISPLISTNQGMGKIRGVMATKGTPETVVQLGEYELTCRHDYTLSWTPGARLEEWPLAGAIIIQTGTDEFYVAGTGIVITIKKTDNPSINVGLLKVDEGSFENGEWKILRHLNGDQTHQGRHVSIPYGSYMTQRVKLYSYL